MSTISTVSNDATTDATMPADDSSRVAAIHTVTRDGGHQGGDAEEDLELEQCYGRDRGKGTGGGVTFMVGELYSTGAVSHCLRPFIGWGR